MDTLTTWQVLRLHGQDNPRLLVRYRFGPLGYRVDLTDLSRVWRESLTRAEIEQRAISSDSSIDPTQDDEQFSILLEKIRASLDHQQTTKIQLSSSISNGEELSFEISATLPQPLPPFHWTLRLLRQDSASIASDLVSPLLHETKHLQNQVEQLVHELREKDRVISKICDRLETSGNDLTTVFPGVSNVKTSRKKAQREQLARHIRGLGDFDEDSWRAIGGANAQKKMTREDWNAVLASLPATDSGHDDLGRVEWWSDLPPNSTTAEGNGPARLSKDGPLAEEAISQVSEFQRQDTPPKHPRKAHSPRDSRDMAGPIYQEHSDPTYDAELILSAADSSTEDEDDLDAPSNGRYRNPGNQGTSAPAQSGQNARASSDKPQVARQEDERQQQLEQEITGNDPVRKFGAIGGRSSKTPSSPGPESERKSAAPKVTSRQKIGAIGGQLKTSKSPGGTVERKRMAQPDAAKLGARDDLRSHAVESEDDGNGQPEMETQPPAGLSPRARRAIRQPSPAPRETSEERADKKRDQLKRELEEKAKAPPVKKKRRF